jgi:stage V sporulation protein SpoVS
MPAHAKTALAALLFLGSASAILADTDNRTYYHDSVVRRAVSVTVSNGHNGAVNHAVKPVTAEEKAWFIAPQLDLVQTAPFCDRGITDTTMTWIKLTEPGGKLIHINVEQVTSVRSNTQIPGAKAQLDLASGKLQGVQENVDQVMQLISAAAGARANDERA